MTGIWLVDSVESSPVGMDAWLLLSTRLRLRRFVDTSLPSTQEEVYI